MWPCLCSRWTEVSLTLVLLSGKPQACYQKDTSSCSKTGADIYGTLMTPAEPLCPSCTHVQCVSERDMCFPILQGRKRTLRSHDCPRITELVSAALDPTEVILASKPMLILLQAASPLFQLSHKAVATRTSLARQSLGLIPL